MLRTPPDRPSQPPSTAASSRCAVFPFGPDAGVVFELRSGERNAQWDLLVEDMGGSATDYLLVSAFCEGRAVETNLAEHERLGALLSKDAEHVWHAIGGAEDGDPTSGDPMWLAIGISRQRGLELGRAFGQSAVLHGRVGQQVERLLCEDVEVPR